MDGSDLRVSVVGDVLLATFSGELQGAAALKFEDELAEAEKAPAEKIVLDLRDVGSIDGTGLALLIDAARRARAQQRHMCVLSSVEVYSTFCGTGLLQAFCNTGLVQAVELVHPCTLDILTRLGWLHDSADPRPPRDAGPTPAPPGSEGPAVGGATVTPLRPRTRSGRRPQKPKPK